MPGPDDAEEPLSQETDTVREGDLVMQKYKLTTPLGIGAMGSVWSATHLSLGHTVAIKFLHGEVARSHDARIRFEREAKLAARLGEASHHIARVIDHGVMDDGIPYLVMEHLQGEALDALLRREKTLSLEATARIVKQLCKALQVAHAVSVVHRDIKPANIFLCRTADGGEPMVKLLDFGVAKARIDNEDAQTTRAGTMIGTPNYMSPEQISGDGHLGARSDLWAVAAIAYRMAVGRPPFGYGALGELAVRIIGTEPTPPSEEVPGLPRAFDDWIDKGLSKSPSERFQTAKELADALTEIVATRDDEDAPVRAPVSRRPTPPSLPPSEIDDEVATVAHAKGHEQVSTRASAAPPQSRGTSSFTKRTAIVLGVVAVGTALFFAGRRSGVPTSTQPSGSPSLSSTSEPSAQPTLASSQPAPSAPPIVSAPASPSSDPKPPVSSVPTTVIAKTATASVTATPGPAASPSASTSSAGPKPSVVAPTPVGSEDPGTLWKKKDEW